MLSKIAMVCFSMTAIFTFSVSALQDKKPRVFITDSKSWEASGGFASGTNGLGGGSGGARPQTAEIVKTFNERCAACIVTMKLEKAEYVIVLEHEGGKGWILRDNKYAVFDKEGDAISSGSTRSLGNSVKDACEALVKNWGSK